MTTKSAKGTNKRNKFRRFSDRRTVLLLEIYETLFHNPDSTERDNRLLQAIQDNYATDMAAFVSQENSGTGTTQIHVAVGDWSNNNGENLLKGTGLEVLWDLQKSAPGALTFTRVKRPPVFPKEAWDNLWNDTLETKMALLSIEILPQQAPHEVLWLLQTNYSREWSSRDRELAEEVAVLIAKARDMAAHT
jgi:GAF domain-containing protein